jgi:hypothetical protein
MSYVGGSISQAAAISGAEGRLSAVEALAAAKVAQSVYDAKVALIDAKDAEQDGRLVAVEAVAAAKVAQSVYDAKVALVDAKDAEQDGRLSAVEGRATALESDIGGRVQSAIDEKVAQTVFDSLASELRSADSALTAALATKVSAVTQASVDALQDSAIATKASLAGVNDALSSLASQFNDEIARLDGVDASKVSQADYNDMVEGLQAVDAAHDAKDAEHDGKLAAIIEFIRALLETYTITKPDGNAYEWTGAAQGLVIGAPPAPAFYTISFDQDKNWVGYVRNSTPNTTYAAVEYSTDGGATWSGSQQALPNSGSGSSLVFWHNIPSDKKVAGVKFRLIDPFNAADVFSNTITY